MNSDIFKKTIIMLLVIYSSLSLAGELELTTSNTDLTIQDKSTNEHLFYTITDFDQTEGNYIKGAQNISDVQERKILVTTKKSDYIIHISLETLQQIRIEQLPDETPEDAHDEEVLNNSFEEFV